MIFRGVPKKIKELEEKSGILSSQDEEKLMHSILEGEYKEEGKLIKDAVNHGLFSFNPSLIFQQLVENYALAKKIYGESFLRELIGDEKDLNLPEVQRKIKQKIMKKFDELKKEDFLSKDLSINEKGIELASLILYMEELDNLIAKGLIGEKPNKRKSGYGAAEEIRMFKHGDRYRNIAIKKSIKLAIRREHNKLLNEDLKVLERESKGKIYVVYALDSSGSMRGEKIDLCKKAGVALAFKAITEKDKVGLLVFGSEIENIVEPTSDFFSLLKNITKIRAKKETNIADTIIKSIELFPSEHVTKHLMLISDAVPTKGEDPEKETLDAVSKAVNLGISVSLIGINLDEKGKKLAEKISELGNGRFYVVKDVKELDAIVLGDYYSLQ